MKTTRRAAAGRVATGTGAITARNFAGLGRCRLWIVRRSSVKRGGFCPRRPGHQQGVAMGQAPFLLWD